MNKEVNFSRFVGLSIVLICVIIVVLALMSAIMQNENATNVIYVEDISGTKFSIPKSNIVTEYINTEKSITSEKNTLQVKVRLPKININTESVESLNVEIYKIYQDMYNYASSIQNDETIEIDYAYRYLNKDTILEITIVKKSIVLGKEKKQSIKYLYDVVNDSYTID